jgi:uncharacterized membrane protein YdbT with pleckstrin-like domain
VEAEDKGGLEDGSAAEVVVEDDADEEEDRPAPSASTFPQPPSMLVPMLAVLVALTVLVVLWSLLLLVLRPLGLPSLSAGVKTPGVEAQDEVDEREATASATAAMAAAEMDDWELEEEVR